MSTGTFTMYAANLSFLNPAALAAGTIQAALVSSSYTPDYTSSGDNEWADVSGYEIANGNGYTTNGATLGTTVATAITGGFKFSSANISWLASGAGIPAWRRVVFYYSGSLGGVTNPLIASALGDATPADVPSTAAGLQLILNCPAGGWFTVTTS